MFNRPGGLAYLAGLVSEAGGNIVRTVSTTNNEGRFYLRMVLSEMDESKKNNLNTLLSQSRFPLESYEIV